LAAAQQLARAGHTVTVFEKSDRIGGLLRYGIPDFKMEKWVIDRRLEQMKAEGVEFKTGVTVGKDITGEQLRQQFDAVGLTMGAEMARDLPVPGRELKGIHFAMEYLTQQNKRTAGISVSEEPITAKGKRVIIIGGGDTGSDCLGTAHRQGCSEAHQFDSIARTASHAREFHALAALAHATSHVACARRRLRSPVERLHHQVYRP
jgi:glutamate synthase (NADPH/NADH) small chain